MNNITIMTDSNAGLSAAEAAALNIDVIPMPFCIDGENYEEGVNLTHADFFKAMDAGRNVTTSQTSPGKVMTHWEEALERGDDVLYIPMSSDLSSSCQSAQALSTSYDHVHVVDNHRISVTLRAALMQAREKVDAGMSAEAIKDELESESFDAAIYAMCDTLEYLKKGGRITPAVAAAGKLLKIKPVVCIGNGTMSVEGKVRSHKAGEEKIFSLVERDLKEKYSDTPVMIRGLCSSMNEDEKEAFKVKLQERFPDHSVEVDMLPLSICAHVGPGTLGVGISAMH